MNLHLFSIDLIAGFLSAQFLLPIIIAIEWNFSKMLSWVIAVFSSVFVFGGLSYLVFVLFGVADGIMSGSGPRDLAIRIGLLIGIVVGCCVVTYIWKPLFYKLYFSINNKNS